MEVANEKAVAALPARDAKQSVPVDDLVGQDLHIDAAIGISMYPWDGEDAEALIMNANFAMYSAKDGGRGRYHFFRSEMNARAFEQ